MNAMDWTIMFIIIGATLVCVLMIVGFLIYQMLVYKHKVRIKEVVNGRKTIIDDKAKTVRDKEGNLYWQLLKEKNKERKKLPIPPSAAIELTQKGKKSVECYRTETGAIAWMVDDVNVEELPADLFKKIPKKIEKIEDKEIREAALEKWRKDTLDEWKKENHVTVALHGLPSSQRTSLINEIRKAEVKRGQSWKQNLPIYFSAAAFVIIILALFVFWGDIAKPVLDSQKNQQAIQQVQLEQLEIIRDIKLGIQQIQGDQENINQRVDNLEKQPPN